MTEKASRKSTDKIREKNEGFKRALLVGDQTEVQRASEELLAVISETISTVEKEIDDWLKDTANDR